jgi:HlyD family secretion protein
MQNDRRTFPNSIGATFLAAGRVRRQALLVGFGLLVIIGAGAWSAHMLPAFQADTRPFTLLYPRYETLDATVNAAGQVKPERVVNLSFRSQGRVSEVLVQDGDVVQQGQPLVRLDDRELRLRVQQAQAALDLAQASYHKLQVGASPEQIAAAEAQVRQANGQLRQIEGSVTPADIRAAEAQLAQAETQLKQVQAGPTPDDLHVAELRLQQAQDNLETQRTQLSAAKTNAQQRLEVAANLLRNRQTDYSRIYWANRQIEAKTSLPQFRADQETEAQRAVENAQLVVDQSQIAYEQARQAEINGVSAAEAQVGSAQAELDKLRLGSPASQVAQAQAEVAAARANLERLRGDQHGGALEAAQAARDQAQANLEPLRNGALSDDLAVAQAQVHSALAALELAKLALGDATLTAPFAGTILHVNAVPGELPDPTVAPVTLADVSHFQVDLIVDEIDVSRVHAGQPVRLTLDALSDTTLSGQVESISAGAIAKSSVTAYQVRVVITSHEPQARAGMSANADIVVQHVQHALVVPRRAVQTQDGRDIVEVLTDPAICALPPEQQPRDPERVPRAVRTGLRDDQMVEISDGLDERACVYVEGVDARMDLLTPLPPGVRGDT